ncbi:Glycine-rich protein DC7.1 precursor, putative [Ricinus communis]|uniref:Glycine-rich protein DC7.1, putative n=1 Tax=Ricinus communis TaxID=3988 RepID=B9SSQ0_RICCO|nr:Glycine-rich protein DC7.1 precursor, putative [Ricinus communis]|eukprot:XP_002529019.1 glycine-rich protein DC7.1 [Ricinus communis]
MAYSKTFLLLGLAFAVVLLLSSQASARELAETVQTQENAQVHGHGDGHGHGGYGHGHGHGGHRGKPGHGGHPETEVED